MPLNHLKKLKKFLIYKKQYPGATIDLTSYLDKNSLSEKDVKIEKDCYLTGSSLGSHIRIFPSNHIINSKLEGNNIIASNSYLQDVILGKFSYVSCESQINLVELGRFCSVGPYLLSGYGDHPTKFVSSHPSFFSTLNQCGTTFSSQDYFEERKPIVIGNDVWIGARVFIKDGVRIGNGAIIAAGAVVVKDVPDYAIVGGIPAKLIRFRFSHEVIEQLIAIQWWNWSVERLRLAQPFFVKEDIHPFIEFANKY